MKLPDPVESPHHKGAVGVHHNLIQVALRSEEEDETQRGESLWVELGTGPGIEVGLVSQTGQSYWSGPLTSDHVTPTTALLDTKA